MAKNRQNLSLPKNFSASQINWLGFLVMGISFLTWLQGQELILQYPKAISFIGMGIGFLTIILRQIDVQPVRLPLTNRSLLDDSPGTGDDGKDEY